VQSETAGFEIINLIGTIMINGSLRGKTIVNTSNLLAGLYFVKITSDSSSELFKILKE
jgi:hypothetical protein